MSSLSTLVRTCAAAAAVLVIAACARPDGLESVSTENATTLPIILAASDVEIEVAPEAGEAGASIAKSLDLYRDAIAIENESGVAAKAIVRIEDFDIVGNTVRGFTGRATELSGKVKLIDAATGEVLVEPVPISVDAKSMIYSEDFGVMTRDRTEAKAQKLSRLFMERARRALYGPAR